MKKKKGGSVNDTKDFFLGVGCGGGKLGPNHHIMRKKNSEVTI